MPALNFQTRFVSAIESGAKSQTIRPERKRPIKVGDNLILYTGQRTKDCRKLGEAVCVAIHGIEFSETELAYTHISTDGLRYYAMAGDPRTDIWAGNDGFENFTAMREFFRGRYGLPFKGVKIIWQKFKPVAGD